MIFASFHQGKEEINFLPFFFIPFQWREAALPP
jgi:hypothetical protein